MKDTILELQETIERVENRRKINLLYLDDNEKLKEFISQFPYLVSIFYHGLEKGEISTLFTYEIIPIDYNNTTIYDTQFTTLAVELFISRIDDNISKDQHWVLLSKYQDFYTDYIAEELKKLEIKKLVSLHNDYYQTGGEIIVYSILYPLDIIIKKCITNEDLLKHLEKIKKQTILNHTLKTNKG